MLLNELEGFLEDEFDYPVDKETVLEEVGEVEVEDANSEESDTIEMILEPLGTDEFESPNALYMTIYGSVGDERVGRKYYDDRSGTRQDSTEERIDEEDQSF